MKRSINSFIGCTIKGIDGEIGKVEEFYFDDRTPTVRYLVKKQIDDHIFFKLESQIELIKNKN